MMQYGHWIVISSDLVPQLLRMFFNFPNFETMMYKAHPFNFQELEHTFSQAKNTFKDNLRKRDKTSCIKMFLCRPLDTETTYSIYFQFAHSSCSSVGVLEKQIHPSECEDKHWLLRRWLKSRTMAVRPWLLQERSLCHESPFFSFEDTEHWLRHQCPSTKSHI